MKVHAEMDLSLLRLKPTSPQNPGNSGGGDPFDIFNTNHPIDMKIFEEDFYEFVVQKKILGPPEYSTTVL